MRICIALVAFALVSASMLSAKLTKEQEQLLIRDLTAEYGTARVLIPRSKDALDILPNGTFDTDEWGEQMRVNGPAARVGDMVQITQVKVKDERLILELNYGIKGGRKWWHRIQVSGGRSRGQTLGQNAATHAPGGTTIALRFENGVPANTAEEFLTILKPVLDFEERSATELYLEQIEPEFREAIEKNEVLIGMNRDMVLLARDKPDRKYRDFKNGVETEDWIYGKPPGDIVFITFEDDEVIAVKHEHANLGGQVAETQPIDR